MKLNVYSIRDQLSGFLAPTVEQSDVVALRNFMMACDRAIGDPTLIKFRPCDYSLYRIGIFDTDSGVLSPENPIEHICSGDYDMKGVLK